MKTIRADPNRVSPDLYKGINLFCLRLLLQLVSYSLSSLSAFLLGSVNSIASGILSSLLSGVNLLGSSVGSSVYSLTNLLSSLLCNELSKTSLQVLGNIDVTGHLLGQGRDLSEDGFLVVLPNGLQDVDDVEVTSLVTTIQQLLSLSLDAIEEANSSSLISAVHELSSNAVNGVLSYGSSLFNNSLLSGLGLGLATNKCDSSNSCKHQ